MVENEKGSGRSVRFRLDQVRESGILRGKEVAPKIDPVQSSHSDRRLEAIDTQSSGNRLRRTHSPNLFLSRIVVRGRVHRLKIRTGDTEGSVGRSLPPLPFLILVELAEGVNRRDFGRFYSWKEWE